MLIKRLRTEETMCRTDKNYIMINHREKNLQYLIIAVSIRIHNTLHVRDTRAIINLNIQITETFQVA